MQKFLQDGTRIPVTEISVPDNAVAQVKTEEKEKYKAVQIGIGSKKNPTKPMIGHVKKANLTAVPTVIREVKVEDDELNAGDFISVGQVFKPGDVVNVSGTSKGKGFAGVVKRHNFRGGPKTHGQSDRLRAPGSIGQTTTPGRVYKGKRMAGRMGGEIVTLQNLKVVDIDEVNKKLYILGLIPGVKGSTVWITRAGEVKNFVPLHTVPVETPEVAPEVEAEVKAEEAAENMKGEANA